MCAGNAQRRTASITGCNLRSHGFERRDDSGHGTPGQRFVAHQLAGESLASENTAQHAHGGSRIAAVERSRRWLQLGAASVNHDGVFVSLQLYSQRGETTQRAGAIRSSGKVLQPRRSFGDGGEHGVAVRDGLVPRQAQCSLDVPRWANHNGGIVCLSRHPSLNIKEERAREHNRAVHRKNREPQILLVSRLREKWLRA